MSQEKNVFLFVMDTARKDRLSAYSYDKDTTPFLTDFSERNSKFTNAVSQAPWTLPSHASMFTGKYPSEHGAIQESPYLEPQETLASILGDNGYKTAVFSANAWISPHTGLTKGFDRKENFLGNVPNPVESLTSKVWMKVNKSKRLKRIAKSTARMISLVHNKFLGEKYNSYTPDIMDSARNFVNNKQGSKFVCLNLLDPHVPYDPPLEYVQKLYDIDQKPDVCVDPKKYNAGVREIPDEEWESIRMLYDAEIRYLDEQIEKFVQFLKDQGEYEDSMIIVCSDHGELIGEHNIYGHQFGVYEELINVPLTIRHPEVNQSDSHESVELIDLFHTILEFSVPESDKYSSERSIFNENYRTKETDVLPYPDKTFTEYSVPMITLHEIQQIAKSEGEKVSDESRYGSEMSVVRDENGKYIYMSEVKDEFFRFDDNRDEDENLIDEIPREAEKYIEVLDEHERTGDIDVESVGAEAIDDSIKDRLGDLGYLN